MKKNTGRKAIVTLALVSATVLAMAASQSISGRLLAEESEKYTGTFSGGRHSIIVDGAGLGDLDVRVYDEDGDLIGKDILPDNDPVVFFNLPYRQKITIKIENTGDYSSSYEGLVQ